MGITSIIFSDVKASGIRPSLSGFWIAEMSGDEHNKKVTPFMGDTYFDLRKRGLYVN